MGLDEHEEVQFEADENATGAEKPKPKTLDDKIFLDMLLTGKTSQVRDLAEQILTHVMHILFRKLDSAEEPEEVRENISNVIDRILKEMIALVPLEVQKYWHKLGAFFTFYHNMVKDFDVRRVQYFMRSNLIHQFMNLTGRYNS